MEPYLDLNWSNLRSMLIQRLAALSDVEYQRRVWVRNEPRRTPYIDDFSETINDLFQSVNDAPQGFSAEIGEELYDQEEADALEPVFAAIDAVVSREHRPPAQVDALLSTPEWARVVAAARAAIAVMKHVDPRDVRLDAPD